MFLKNKNIIFKIRRSKVTDYAALKVLSHQMNVSSGVSKVNSIYVYIRPKHFLFSVTLTTLIFWGLLFMPPKGTLGGI